MAVALDKILNFRKREDWHATDSVKPTYYFDEKGVEVGYIEHAQFIQENAWTEDGWRYYPMLEYRNEGDHIQIHLRVISYERKLATFEAFQENKQEYFEEVKKAKRQWHLWFNKDQMKEIAMCLHYQNEGADFAFPNAELMRIVNRFIEMVEGQ